MEKLSKNFFWMAAAHITGSLFNLITGIYLARILMPEALGYLSYVFTIIFFFSNFIDLGLSTYGVREIASDKPHFSEYVSEIASFRLTIAGILCALFMVTAFLVPRAGLLKILLIESSLFFFVWASATEWAFQGVEKMHMVFFSLSTTAALQLALVYTFVHGPKDVLLVPILYVIAAMPITVTFLYKVKFRFRISTECFRKVSTYLSSSLIIWSISVFAQVYNSLDVFILGIFRSIGEVGYFTIARRIIGGCVLLMVFLANAILPRLSSSFACKDTGEFRRATRKFLKLAVILTVALFVPLGIFGKYIIALAVGSQYSPAGLPLAIMVAGVIMILFNLPYSTALIAAHFEKEVLKQSAASAALSIFLNFELIPKYGMIGSSISFVAAEILALCWILLVYHRKIRSQICR